MSTNHAAGASPWRFVRYMPSDRQDWCSFPGQMVNVETGDTYMAACGTARASKCAYCAGVKRQDVASIGRSGWTDKPTDRGVWLTLTAPGQDVLPWDKSKCTHSANVPCSGKIGCQCERVPLAVWHSNMGARWTHFMTDLRRALNPGMTGPPSSLPVTVEFVKTYEPQARGALHVHTMMRVAGVVSERRLIAAIEKASKANGFGSQLKYETVDLSDSRRAARVAGYVAKYTSKCSDALGDVTSIDIDTGEFGTVGLRAWSASWNWGDRMWETIARRQAWAVRRASGGAGAAVAPSGVADVTVTTGALDPYQDLYADEEISNADLGDIFSEWPL